jgi:hypothetical protein
MSIPERATIADWLQRALRLTEALLEAGPTIEGLDAMVSARAPLLDAAGDARDSGDFWGTDEAELARRILETDTQLLEQVWREQADAFSWLRERDESLDETFPRLRALSVGTTERAAPSPGAGGARHAAACYERTRSAY